MSDRDAILADADREIWLTVQELARLKRVHEQTVRTWIRQGLVIAERTAGPRGRWRVKIKKAA